MPHHLSETKFLHGTTSFVLFTLLSSQLCFGITSTKRQATGDGILAGDLLPPPALSKSFPTLKPRSPPPPPRNNIVPSNNGLVSPPSRDLLPPGRPAGAAPLPPRPSPAAPTRTTNDFPLLPPIEIPPEKPLTDSEISAFKETSFIPTTGQGAGNNNNNNNAASAPQPQVAPQLGASSASAQPSSNSIQNQQNNVIATQSSSNVRFPSDSSSAVAAPSQAPSNCPSCECTSEVDYICGSNRVLYLNSCSFDCATVCDAGLKKFPLEFCVSQNQQR